MAMTFLIEICLVKGDHPTPVGLYEAKDGRAATEQADHYFCPWTHCRKATPLTEEVVQGLTKRGFSVCVEGSWATGACEHGMFTPHLHKCG